MEEIIRSIREAEAQAEELLRQAAERAAKAESDAAERAAQIGRASEADCRKLRETRLAAARQRAEKEYSDTVSAEKAKATDEADALLLTSELHVNRIVRRICGDR